MPDEAQPRQRRRAPNLPYKFTITNDCSYETGWVLPREFDSRWLHISTTGVVTVKANNQNGYAWDGCTPKWSLLNLWIVGVPDGHVDYRTGKPHTYFASLVHDVLYQYLDSVPVQKADIDDLFFTMMGDFKLRWPYYLAVRFFGGLGVKQRSITK